MSEAVADKANDKASEQQDTKAVDQAKAQAESEGINFSEWLKSQPKEIREALDKNESGLKGALEKEREEAKKARRELERIERERKLAEDQKLKDEGRWKDIAEANEKRLKELQAKLEAEEWQKATRAKLKDSGLTDFEDVLLASRETPDDVAATGKRLAELINARVEAEVNKRLDTGKRPASQGAQKAKGFGDFDTSTPEGAKAFAEFVKSQGLYR